MQRRIKLILFQQKQEQRMLIRRLLQVVALLTFFVFYCSNTYSQEAWARKQALIGFQQDSCSWLVVQGIELVFHMYSVGPEGQNIELSDWDWDSKGFSIWNLCNGMVIPLNISSSGSSAGVRNNGYFIANVSAALPIGITLLVDIEGAFDPGNFTISNSTAELSYYSTAPAQRTGEPEAIIDGGAINSVIFWD